MNAVPALKTFIVEQGPNPSTDFFVVSALALGDTPFQRFGFGDLPPVSDLANATVIFVRYVPPEWKAFLEENLGKAARIVYFMDDDLFDIRAWGGMPRRYQWKLFSLAWRHQRWLKKVGAQLRVSTPWLAQKYSEWNPVVVEPSNPHGVPAGLMDTGMQTVFYHGSASHRGELEWLVPVVEQVLAARDDVCFEVMGDRKVRDRFAHLPGVQVVHPMSWPAYKAFIQRPGRTIGLAPLLDTPFNAARAPTKFFDITAAGAVGIYADTPVYQRLVKHKFNGLMLPMDSQEAWSQEILKLLASPKLRGELYSNARK